MDFLTAHARRQPDKPAVICGDTVLSYAEHDERSNRLANALQRLGVGHLDRCTTIGYNAAEHLTIGAAVRKLVAVSLPMNYRLRPDEIHYQLDHSQSRIVFCGPEHVERVEEAAAHCPSLEHRVAWGSRDLPAGWRAFEDLIASGNAQPPQVESGLTGPTMTYTAGTTGNPKGAYRSRGTDPAVIEGYVRWFELRPDDVHLAAGPLYHSAPGAFASFQAILGATAVVMPRFEAEEALRLVERRRCTTTFMAPTLLQRITALPADVRRRYDVSSMRVIIVAAAPCPFEVKRSVMELFGEVLYEFYGSSELGVNALMLPHEQLTKPGSCGRIVDGVEIEIRDDDGRELPPGQPGELWIKSPQEISEYWRNEEATTASRRNGYFTVGDVGYVDDDGYLYIVDRKRDMVISGGVNICTTEVENVIHAHPEVWDVAVIGVPSDEWGESVHAIVQPRPGADLDGDALLAWIAERVADYKKPRSLEIRDELPRDDAGKIRKRDLREPFWAGRDRRV